jgi:NAD(P)H dehydrogenase (quinone)
MKVLTVFAHPGKKSFCHSVLERFDAGLRDSGHTSEIVDLYAIGFDPVLRERDSPNWMDANAPDDIIAKMNLRERMLEAARKPFRRFLVAQNSQLLRNGLSGNWPCVPKTPLPVLL